jgi:hypothetical protein
MKPLFIFYLLMTSPTNAGNFKSLEKRKWLKVMPRVLVCQDSIDMKLAIEAVNFWKKQGYQLKDPTERKNCKTTVEIDTIKFIRQLPSHNILINQNGITNRKFDGNRMFGANIIIKTRLNDKLELIKHELGHALGLEHSSNTSHVMYHLHSYYTTSTF